MADRYSDIVMSSLRKVLSARANGAKSHGPITPEGIRRSSLNALRHGLTAKTIVLTNESPDRFDQLLASYVDALQPADELEMDLVEEMAAAKWRQLRLWGIETSSLDLRMDHQQAEVAQKYESADEGVRLAIAFTSLTDYSSTLQHMNRYESRLSHTWHRAFINLVALQAARETEAPQNANLQNDPNPISGHLDSSASSAPLR